MYAPTQWKDLCSVMLPVASRKIITVAVRNVHLFLCILYKEVKFSTEKEDKYFSRSRNAGVASRHSHKRHISVHRKEA